MATEHHKLKLAKTTEEEIHQLFTILNEVQQLRSDLSTTRFDNINWHEFEVLYEFNYEDPESFLEDLIEHISGIHFSRILMNCLTLLSNCADPDKDHVDFHPDIKKGLELLEKFSPQEDVEDRYYIQNGFVGNAMLFWHKSNSGYMADIREARRFTKKEAMNLLKSCPDKDFIAWPCYVCDEAIKPVVDGQYVDRRAAVKDEDLKNEEAQS